MSQNGLDPMIEQYKAQLMEFSRKHPKFSAAPPQEEQSEESVTVQADEPAQRLVPQEELYRADFAQNGDDAITVEMRVRNVSQREQMLPQDAPQKQAEQPAAQTVRDDPHEREFAQCDATDPPYCNGTIDTFPTREAFLQANASYGYLRVQASVAQQAYPVQNARVEISKTFSGDKFVFFDTQTDASGIVPRVTLPAPDRDLSSAPSALQPYATYDIFVSHPNFTDVYVPNCIVFATIETIQQIRMVPLETCAENPEQAFCGED